MSKLHYVNKRAKRLAREFVDKFKGKHNLIYPVSKDKRDVYSVRFTPKCNESHFEYFQVNRGTYVLFHFVDLETHENELSKVVYSVYFDGMLVKDYQFRQIELCFGGKILDFDYFRLKSIEDKYLSHFQRFLLSVLSEADELFDEVDKINTRFKLMLKGELVEKKPTKFKKWAEVQ